MGPEKIDNCCPVNHPCREHAPDNRPDSGERDWRETEVAPEYSRGYEDGFFAGQRSDEGAPLTERQIAESFVADRPDPSTPSEGTRQAPHDDRGGWLSPEDWDVNPHADVTRDAAPTEREEGPMTDHAKGEGRIARPEKPTRPPDVPASPPPARRAHHQGEDSNDALAHTLESMAGWVEGGAVLREAARRLRTTRTEQPKDSVRCTCEWAHPVQGYVGLYPAELDPECEVHGAPAGFPDISEWCAVYLAALEEEGG